MSRKGRDHLNLLCDIGDLANLLTGSENIRTFLQKTAELVSDHLSADVCSIYLYDEKSNDLVLMSTKGLNPEAVEKIRLKPGEGLVGISLEEFRPVCEGEAGKSPFYRYFAEAGEEKFESFLAVPMRRGVEKIGVIVVQNEEKNYFDDFDVMALRASASQLAGAIENARLLMSLLPDDVQIEESFFFEDKQFIKGDSASAGYAYGPATVFRKTQGSLLSPGKGERKEIGIEEFNDAVRLTGKQLEEMQEVFAERLPESASLIFTAHFMILKDPGFVRKMTEKIESGVYPPDAVREVARHYISIFSSSSHAYIREKANDVEDLSGRILRNLLKRGDDDSSVGDKRVIIASELFPSDILKLASEDVKGIILVSGGITSHVSILSRSLQIPLIIADKPELMRVKEGVRVLLDADVGNIYVDPPSDIVKQFELSAKTKTDADNLKERVKDETFTSDGEKVTLLANINLLNEVSMAREIKAEGVGLYRTEFPFLIRATFPSEDEQYVVYKRLFDDMGDKPVTIRTLDVGGDKVLAYSDATDEVNPALGLRSIRFSLRYREIFEQQIRAILRAGAGSAKLKIMFPMISSMDEFITAKEHVLECIATLCAEGLPCCTNPEIGMMVELPAVVETMEAYAGASDFFSIGTNDFVQYMLAVDRTNKKVSEYYCPGHPSVIRGLARIIEAAVKAGKEISVCGEMAHQAEFIPFLLGVGVRTLSVEPRSLPIVQDLISAIKIEDAKKHASALLKETTIEGVDSVLKSFK